MRRALAAILLAALVGATPAGGAVYNLTPVDDWFSVLHGSALSPGDEVVLAAGTYSDSRRLSIGHQGTAAEPIIIRAATGAAVTITRPNANQNVINLEGARYLTLRGVEVTGGSTGIRIRENNAGADAKFLTIEDSLIHHVGGPAITANYENQTYEGMIFRRNEIHNTGGHGEGFYLGSNNNGSQFYDGLIENNYIHDLTSKKGVFQGDGIEIKDGSYNNTIRGNIIRNTDYPGVLVYSSNGHDQNVIEDNVIWAINNHGIQAGSDAIIRNNIIFNCDIDGIRSQDHQSAIPGNMEITGNTIFSYGSGDAAIRISTSNPLSGPISITNNGVYAAPGTTAIQAPSDPLVTRSGNVAGSILVQDSLTTVTEAGGQVVVFGSNGEIGEDFSYSLASGGRRNHLIVDLPAGQFYRIDAGAEVLAGYATIAGMLTFVEDVAGAHDITLTALADPLAGDADLDGRVSDADYTIWANNFGAADVDWTMGDFNADRLVDQADYDIWAGNYGATAPPPAPSAVPEPAALALLALTGVALLRKRRALS